MTATTSSLVTVDTPDGPFAAWYAPPPPQVSTRGVGILMVPETYNLNGWVKQAAQQYADRGYHVLVPDLYWRQEPGLALEYNPQDQERGRALNRGMDRRLCAIDAGHAAAWLRGCLPAGAAVGSIGFCLGGELAWLAAGAGHVDGAAAYYPTGMRNHLALGATIAVPVLIHFGELDTLHTPPDVIEAVHAATAANPWIECHTYLGAGHGFNRFGHPPHHAPSAALAEQRTLALLERIARR